MMSACSSVSVFMWWVWRHVGINHWKILTRPKTLLFFFFIIISFVHPLSLVKPRVESVWVLKFKNLCLLPSKGCEHEKNSEHIEHIIKYICHVFDRTFFLCQYSCGQTDQIFYTWFKSLCLAWKGFPQL